MIELIIVLAALLVLFAWSATATCSLSEFEPKAVFRSQFGGPDSYDRLVGSLLALPGVRKIESDERSTLVSVTPVLSSMGRGYGLFVVVRRDGNGVVLLGRPRIPLPAPNMPTALRELERAARQAA
ncbi:MAG TPA: hypothetical protein VH333_26690 [Pseudonocardiaceae bacterium]|jgi:hypothetical protein|nr:hypothetical protein [Pseudonocardiaceae bacterium]